MYIIIFCVATSTEHNSLQATGYISGKKICRNDSYPTAGNQKILPKKVRMCQIDSIDLNVKFLKTASLRKNCVQAKLKKH